MNLSSLHIRIARALTLVGEQGEPSNAQGLPLRNAPSPLKVLLPFIKARGERRRRRLRALADQPTPAAESLILPADHHWHDAGMVLKAGEQVQLTASGRLFMSRVLEVSIGAQGCLWYRIGDGEIARLPSAQAVITATADGPLRLQAALPGAFGSLDGEISTENPPWPVKGALHVSIRRILQDGQQLSQQLSQELSQKGRACVGMTTPPGWQYLWRLGHGAIFHRCEEDASLCCDTLGDVGILQYPLDLALDDDVLLDWQWLVEELPSRLPEHIQPTHDYLSIAVEFDNGLDLTWMWSSSLAAGTIFQCPLPWWDKRETHWVLRNPEDGLGQWHSESRNLCDDYRQAIGGRLPRRVVGVWLIANSVFQSGQGRCRYRGIKLRSAAQTLTIPL